MTDTLLERSWADREERLYPSLFGPTSRGIFLIPPGSFEEDFQQTEVDPRWLHLGAFEFAPTPNRPSWLYVTSGLSNEWERDTPDPEAESGLGVEFLIESPAASAWALRRLLHLMTFELLLAHGRYPGRERLLPHDRLPLRGPIDFAHSALDTLTLALPTTHPEDARLESGSFTLLQVIGITAPEATFARTHGGEALLRQLQSAGVWPVTDPGRASVSLPAS